VNLYGLMCNQPTGTYDRLGLTLGSDITRIFLSRLLTPVLTYFRSDHYDLVDTEGEMAQDLSAQLNEFYSKFICAKGSEATGGWKPLLLPKTNASAYLGEAFLATEGLKGWWLSGSCRVDLHGGLEYRCDGKGCLEYRALHVVGEWHDAIDANSFPLISD